MTIVPWSRGRQLEWDATCVDPLCSSNILRSSKAVGAAVEKAVRNKRRDYSSVCSQYWFVAFAVDCLGVWCRSRLVGMDLSQV